MIELENYHSAASNRLMDKGKYPQSFPMSSQRETVGIMYLLVGVQCHLRSHLANKRKQMNK